jgi:ketosteroid isomerase-like protein
MNRISVGILLFLGACSKEAPMPLDIAQSKQMIWEVIKAYHDASDKDDLDVIQTLLTPDASIVLGREDVIRGRENVLRALRDQMKSWGGKPRSTITGKEVIKPDGNIALVTYVASVGTDRGIITAICSRNKDNKWQIAHMHDTTNPNLRK